MNQSELYKIFDSYNTWTAIWHDNEAFHPLCEDTLLGIILELHKYNYMVWHNEDIVRRNDVGAHTIANVKREIDTLNQKRNDTIERVDEWLFNNHFGHLAEKELPMRTETPGSVFDRLSILALKVFHMLEQTKRTDVGQPHINICKHKLTVLLQQQRDLQESLLAMLNDLNNGIIRMKVYRQFKMYNDPNLNPQLYEKNSICFGTEKLMRRDN